MATALKIENINKHFGKRHVLKNLSLETYTGEVFGFLGPNGAGKTTLIKLIVGLLKIEDGQISVCGKNVQKNFADAMANVGGIVENPEMYKYMSGMQNLRQYANMRKGITDERINEVVELVGLKNRIHEKVGKYSLGMRQRLGLAQSLLHKPKLLILDEPTNGLDPSGIKQLRDILKRIAHEEDVCVFVSSHLMSEMQLMCDRVGIIVQGSLKSVQTIDEIMLNMDGGKVTYTYTVPNTMETVSHIRSNYPDIEIICHTENSFNVILPINDSDEVIANINACIINGGYKLYTVSKQDTRSLEDAFIELTREEGPQIA